MATLDTAARPTADGTEQAAVNVGVVGLGYWGPNLVRNFQDLEVAEITWMCDRRPGLLKALGRRYPAVQTTVDLDEMLADDTLEAIAIATPVSTHYDVAMRALAAGKHVFVEKPLAHSSEHAEVMIDTASLQGLVLMPGHTFLYSPPVNLVHDLITSGELGDIYFISMSRVNLGMHQSDVSVIWDLAPHDFSILLYWLGRPPAQITGMTRACVIPGQPDVAFINCEFGSGTIAHLELAWLAPSKLRRTAVVGSKKMVIYDDGSIEPVKVYDSGIALPNPSSFGTHQLTYRTGDIVSPHIEAVEPIALQLADFCWSIRTGETPRSSAHLGLEVVAMIEAAERGSEDGSDLGGRQLEDQVSA
jgi:predicted dehydrogenase